MWARWIELAFVILLGWIVLTMTLPFEVKYEETLRKYAGEPLFRIVTGFLIVAVANFSLPLSLLLFLISFFWITDVHLVTSIKN
jgi:pilus assembly protein TadC